MKKLLNLLIFIFITYSADCQFDYQKYPSYENVFLKYLNKYSVSDLEDNQRVRLEKRPDGWHVCVYDVYNENKRLTDELFWSLKKEKYLKLKGKKITTPNENEGKYELYRDPQCNHYFVFSPYYGYPGWTWDVIQNYKDLKNLPDSTFYALGRAYTDFANDLLNNNKGYKDTAHWFNLPDGKNSMTPKQLEEYRFYQHTGIKIFEELARRNPKFETMIGTISNKAANQYVTSFLDLREYQNEEEAMKELKPGLYSDFLISIAKNYLNSCDSNAILFVNGDNDTYPLLYVQAQYGFRTDVLVVNMSLLQTLRYIYSLQEQILDAKPFPLSFTKKQLDDVNREIIYFDNLDGNPMPLLDALDSIKNDSTIKFGENGVHFSLSTNKYWFTQGSKAIEFQLRGDYFYRRELVIFDMLLTNYWERPVYFSTTMAKECYLGLETYLKMEGFAYKLTSDKLGYCDDRRLGYINIEKTFDNIMYKFDYKGIDSATSLEKLFFVSYKVICHNLVDTLIKSNKLDSAKIVLNKIFQLIPNKLMYLDFYSVSLIEDYYKIHEDNTANALMIQLIYNVKNKLDSYVGASEKMLESYREYTIYLVKEIAEKYNQPRILRELELYDQK